MKLLEPHAIASEASLDRHHKMRSKHRNDRLLSSRQQKEKKKKKNQGNFRMKQ